MLLGVLDNQPGAPRDIVVLNAGAALYAANVTDSIQAGIAQGPQGHRVRRREGQAGELIAASKAQAGSHSNFGDMPCALPSFPVFDRLAGLFCHVGHGAGPTDPLLQLRRCLVPAGQDRIREEDRHFRRHDAQELGRDLCPDQGRGVQSQGRRLVGRHRRPAPAGGRGRADRGLCLADAHQLHDWANSQAVASKVRTVGIYSGALGYSYNTDLLKKQGLPEPKCWADLIKPVYKGKIQVANPNSSGTAYTMLATLVQLFGEDEAFDYMKALHANINQYTKSGSAPIKAAGARARPHRHRLHA
jgi:hypothetical protein